MWSCNALCVRQIPSPFKEKVDFDGQSENRVGNEKVEMVCDNRLIKNLIYTLYKQ